MFTRTNKLVWGLPLLALALLLLASANPADAADSNWRAKYWNNRDFSGDPVLERNENNLNHDWGSGSPDSSINKDNFSARWTRTVNFPNSGTYRFTATTDDGMRVWVDDNLIIDSWHDSQVHSLTADIHLNAGDHALKVRYYEAGGKAVAKLNWNQVGSSSTSSGNWRGEYFNNMTLSGTPALVRDDRRIDFEWGGGAPASGVAADQFSVRWTHTVSLEGGRYEFTARGDDGIRVWANEQLVINEWHEAQGQFYTGKVNLPAGSVPIKVEYYENAGGATAFVDFKRIGSGTGSSAGSWRGEYFNNRNLSGNPTMTRDDAQLNFRWGTGSPAGNIASDNFSVRWTRNFSFAAGTYRFTAVSDDGIRVWVNNQPVINAWDEHAARTDTGDITLSAGTIPVRVEYFEATGGAEVRLNWALLATNPAPTVPVVITGPSGTVVSQRLNIRRGPGLDFSVIASVPQGTVLPLAGFRSANGNWVMINHNGGQAWVSARPAYLSANVTIGNLPVWQGTVMPIEGKTAVVGNAYFVNLRQAPQVVDNIIQAVPAGTRVQLLGRNSNSSWVKVQLPNQAIGWMSTNYLINRTVSISTLPLAN